MSTPFVIPPAPASKVNWTPAPNPPIVTTYVPPLVSQRETDKILNIVDSTNGTLNPQITP